jgi:hypothetical protein
VDSKLFFAIRIPCFSEFCIRIWIRVLLDLQNVPDPTLNICSFIIAAILKVFSWHFKSSFSGKNVRLMFFNVINYQIANFCWWFLVRFMYSSGSINLEFRIRSITPSSGSCKEFRILDWLIDWLVWCFVLFADLRPRFPLFGGWKTHYVVGYNVPSYEYLFYKGNYLTFAGLRIQSTVIWIYRYRYCMKALASGRWVTAHETSKYSIVNWNFDYLPT